MTKPSRTTRMLLEPDIPVPHLAHNWQSLFGSGASYATAMLASRNDQFLLYIARDNENAYRIKNEIDFYSSTNTQTMSFPDWETLPYDNFSPHQDIISDRIATLNKLPQVSKGALIVPVQTLMQRLPPVHFMEGQSLVLTTGQRFSIANERQRLHEAGYRSVQTVIEHGEYAVRGSLMDIYPMGSPLPFRIDLFDDEIESLRTFDPDTQRTADHIDSTLVLPAKEIPLDPKAISLFRDRWHNTFDTDVRRCQIYQDVSNAIAPPGIEFYLPYFFDKTATLFDYLPASAVIIEDHGVMEAASKFIEAVETRYESLRHDIEKPILEPKTLYMTRDEIAQRCKAYGRIRVDPRGRRNRHTINFRGQKLPDIAATYGSHDQARALKTFINHATQPVLLTAETQGRRQHLEEFLERAGIRVDSVASFNEFIESTSGLALCVGEVERGTWLPDIAIITEAEIFGQRNKNKTNPTRRGIDPDLIIRNLTELSIGAPVVHIDHGVGRYLGLETLEIDQYAQEFLTLEYADETRLYLPVMSLHLISRYSGADADHAPLNRLGSDQWEKAKRRAAEKIFDVAAELLDIYARRETGLSMALDKPDGDYALFCDQFQFETTPDQQRAIDDVIEDLSSKRSTDRLICGDVGFGKTEVAMRATFLAVQSGKQVAILVPTTLLAQQHYETFRDRFADWPVQIEVVSRLRSNSEISLMRDHLGRGTVDVVIGTHRLLSEDIQFRALGLAIIDEEHRFGVRQKERLRALRSEINVLALTATPIPRTLNMAMFGMRDLSIITTPPAKRLSIKTFVIPKRIQVVREAVTRELARGGQVFYLHNHVETIQRTATELEELFPTARIGIGHGQMAKRELARVMTDFYHRRCNLLVCTTIIENGIDIPNANTIIIERADHFGLAQLHQLRGRVGRSNRQAYAYLMTPHAHVMTRDAQERLEAIETAGELGIGFTLATHDLEIRGAGELLGEDQSGQIATIGFSLYTEMLDRAVTAIKLGHTPNLDQPLTPSREVDIHVQALIPEVYLPDVHMRLIMYKRISNAGSPEELSDIKIEMIDRFGSLPDAVENLFRSTEIKIQCEQVGIHRVDIGATSGRIEFDKNTQVDPRAVVSLVQKEPQIYQLLNATRLKITAQLQAPEQRYQFVESLLGGLLDKNDEPISTTAIKRL